MIETEQSIQIDAPIATVWGFAEDINKWAKLMPGLQNCDVIDADDSRWILKVGVGAMIRTVKVFVHVDRWSGPDEVDFTYNVEGDPVNGGGIYRARSVGPDQTEITLGVRVIGEGPMAPMWEAMGRPMLPKFARSFAEQFKAEVELQSVVARAGAGRVQATASQAVHGSLWSRFKAWLKRLFGAKPATTNH